MRVRYASFALLFVGYLTVFSIQDQRTAQSGPSLTLALPAIVQKMTLGFFKELGSERLFVESAVFNGHRLSQSVMADNANSLSFNLDTAVTLYPDFIDPYYLAQASLPHISPEYAAITNEILAHYSATDQQDIVVPFFRGFNYFYYMYEPQAAAEVFSGLASREDAPSWFGHFAGILSARGGDLYAGLISLQSMLAVETDEKIKARYRRDISVFEKAIMVQKATDVYSQTYGVYPENLTQLVPVFIPFLPELEGGFSLEWIPPKLRLVRPTRR